MNTKNVTIAVVVAIIIVGSGVAAFELHNRNGSSPKVTLSETGSSLLFPVFNEWAKNYTNATITTASTGSGTGISSAISGTDVIGASDAYMSSTDANANPGVMNIPILISYQYITYNIPGLNNHTLRFNATVLTGIYNGSIAYWDNSQIKAENPSVASLLPHQPIVPVHRSDGSGDSFMFSSFMSKGDAWFAKNVGASTTPNWPTGVTHSATGAQNSGVIATMKSDPYSIGYVAATYASTLSQDGFGIAQLQNAAGNYVTATPANVSEAAAQYLSDIPANGTIALQYAPGATAYPIADMEYVIIRENQSSNAVATALQNFLKWVVSPNGGSASNYLSALNLAPLPANVVSKITDPLINRIHGPGGSSSAIVTLSETGSSLLYPAFNEWAPNYTAATITTASTGSGTGISSAIAGTDVIGASDAFLAPSVANANPNVMNIPILISYQYIVYNIPGYTGPKLNLNANIIVGIYNGSINYWDNSQILSVNPGAAGLLPHKQIIPVHRSDGSGDSFMFSSFLSKANSWWAANAHASTTPTWPSNPYAATGAQNSGVIATMNSDPYSIGYVAATYASTINADHFGIAALQNAAGNYVNATPANVSEAAAQYLSQIPANGTIALQYAPGATAYPIADMEYVIVQKTQPNSATATELQAFLKWIVNPNEGSAAKYLSPLNLAALPSNVVANITTPLINKITG